MIEFAVSPNFYVPSILLFVHSIHYGYVHSMNWLSLLTNYSTSHLFLKSIQRTCWRFRLLSDRKLTWKIENDAQRLNGEKRASEPKIVCDQLLHCQFWISEVFGLFSFSKLFWAFLKHLIWMLNWKVWKDYHLLQSHNESISED